MSINENYPHIADHIAEAMQRLGDMPETLPQRIEQAAAHISQQLVSGNKLLVQGTAGIAPLAGLFCYNLLQRYPEQRPALPAIILPSSNLPVAAELMPSGTPSQANSNSPEFRQFFRAAEAIANKGDVLLLLADQRMPGIIPALEQFHASRGASTILMAPEPASNSPGNTHTKHIPLEYDTIAGIHEMSLFILNTLGDMIDAAVFGGMHFSG
ncbi:MAG: SIS domain-containing protein [Pseudomonadales bacterium]|nr:SIS domain-containing protein [Gammaproteobacteria bacterium]NNL57036.1 SIS domain-containing protein [Pseudomonadales bacterium]